MTADTELDLAALLFQADRLLALLVAGRPRRRDAAWKTARECSALLGLDPASRTRLKVRCAAPVAANPFFALGPAPDRG